MADKKNKPMAEKGPDQVAYIGPDIRQPVHLMRYQVFRNGLPKEVETKLEQAKVKIDHFLVPVKDLGAAMADLRNPESALARKYAEAKGGI